MTTQTKILIVAILVFVLILGGLFFAYQYFINDGGSDLPISVNGGNGPLFPATGGAGGGTSTQAGSEQEDSSGPVPTLRQISNVPTAGGIAFATSTEETEESRILIRYIERASGHVFETSIDSLSKVRVSNTTIPRVQRSFWLPDGSAVILQYLDENEVLKSFYGEVATEDGGLDGWFLSNNIISATVHEDGDLFYLQRIGNGAQGVLANFDGTDASTLFSSELYDWRAEWKGSDIALSTKATNGVEGYVYELQSGGLEDIVSGLGISARMNPSGTQAVVSTNTSVGVSLFIYDTETGETTQVPFRTFAEKCAWATDVLLYCASPYDADTPATFPDDWYKGIASFSDDLWSFNTNTETAQLIYDMEAEGRDFDITNLVVAPDERALLFTDKNTLTLWSLLLE